LTDTYQKATPWVAGKNNPNSVWGTSSTAVLYSLDGGTETSSFRLGFTNLLAEGNLPNSNITRNNHFSGSQDLSDKLTVLLKLCKSRR
jgi:hypothetical protein